jgi:hypothetical protein
MRPRPGYITGDRAAEAPPLATLRAEVGVEVVQGGEVTYGASACGVAMDSEAALEGGCAGVYAFQGWGGEFLRGRIAFQDERVGCEVGYAFQSRVE